jgi:hypothetical protein
MGATSKPNFLSDLLKNPIGVIGTVGSLFESLSADSAARRLQRQQLQDLQRRAEIERQYMPMITGEWLNAIDNPWTPYYQRQYNDMSAALDRDTRQAENHLLHEMGQRQMVKSSYGGNTLGALWAQSAAARQNNIRMPLWSQANADRDQALNNLYGYASGQGQMAYNGRNSMLDYAYQNAANTGQGLYNWAALLAEKWPTKPTKDK